MIDNKTKTLKANYFYSNILHFIFILKNRAI